MLGPAGDLGRDPDLLQFLREILAGFVDVALALGPLLRDQALDLGVLTRVESLEGEVLELPFERVDAENRYEGTGIGLAIVRKGIERMGGTVGVESDGVTGSRFWLELDAANQI